MPNNKLPRLSISKSDKKFVLLADTPEKPRLDSFTTDEYAAIPIAERQRRVKTTLDYLRSIPQIPKDTFTNADGKDVDSITLDSLVKTRTFIHQNLPPVRSSQIKKNIPRMPTEITIHWIYALQNKLNQLMTAKENRKKLTGTTSLLNEAIDSYHASQEELIREILSEQKSRWLSHDLKISSVKAALKSNSAALRKMGFTQLADLAYRSDGTPSLHQQLPVTEIFEKNQARLNDNMYGRVFETALINSLVEQPPNSLFLTMTKIAKGLNAMLDEMAEEDLCDMLMPRLDNKLRDNKRPWFEKVPAFDEFLNAQKTGKEKLAALRKLLNEEIKSGYQVIGIAYLVQKLYITRYGLKNYINGDNLQWMLTTQSIYDQIDSIKINSNQNHPVYQGFSKTAKNSKNRLAPLPVSGITNSHQPAAVTPLTTGPSDRPSNTKVANFDPQNMQAEVKNALTYGIPHATGISGTTNIFLGTLTHLKTDLHYDINAQEALLGLLMFLNFDGGHSIHEVLWMVNHRESQAAGKKYISLGLGKAAANRHSIIKSKIYISDYEKLFSYYKKTDAEPYLSAAYANAWKKTLDYFDQYSAYKTSLEKIPAFTPDLGQIFARFDEIIFSYPESKRNFRTIRKEIEPILLKYAKDENISVGTAAEKLTPLFHSSVEENPNDPVSVLAIYSLFSIGYKEQSEQILWQEINNHAEFKNFKKENLWRLVESYQDQISGSQRDEKSERFYARSMYTALKKMLKHRQKMLTTVHLRELYDTFVDKCNTQVPTTHDENIPMMMPLEEWRNIFFKNGYQKEAGEYDLIVKNPTNNDRFNATEKGVQELIQKSLSEHKKNFEIKDYRLDSDGHLIADSNGKVATLATSTKKKKNIQAYVETAIVNYYVEIARAKTDEQKLTAIARLCRDLASSQIFKNENSSIIGILVMNKLLLQNGFSPVVLDNHKHLEGFAVSQLVDDIKLGQTIFERVASYKNSTQIEQQHSVIEDDPSTLWQESDVIASESETESESESESESETETETETEKIKQEVDPEYVKAYQQRYTALEDRLLDENHPDFKSGYDFLSHQKVPIPGYDKKMSTLEMQALAVDGGLNLKALGALMRRIMLEQAPEIDGAQVLRELTETHTAFQDLAGFIYKRPMSQALYTMAVDNLSSGLCYGLTWTMAAALKNQGESAADRFAQRLYEAAEYPQARAAVLTQTVLKALHQYANSIYRKKMEEASDTKKYTLAEIVARIEEITDTQMYELNTVKHAMMVGVLKNDTQRRFYFYDPNAGIAAYSSSAELHTALNRYLNEERLSEYQPFTQTNSESATNIQKFEFERIDTQAVAKLKFEVAVDDPNFYNPALTTEDLFSPDSLRKALIKQQEVEAKTTRSSLESIIDKVNTNLTLKRSLSALDNQYLAKNYLKSAEKLYVKNQLSQDWMPLLSKIEESKTGYRIPFINRRQPTMALTWLNSTDDTFFKMKTHVEEYTQAINQSHTLSDSFTLDRKSNISEVGGIDGMNAGFALQQLITWVQQSHREASVSPEMSTNLATALNIHSYVSLAQIAQGTSHDVTEVVSIVRTLITESKQIEVVPASLVTKTLSHSMQGIGAILGAGAVVLDAYEFTHAENAIQKSVFGTQLGFDSASVAMSAAGIGAGLAGATTVAGVLGPLGVVVAGVGIGATGLAQAYGEVAEDTKAVAAYFSSVDRAYQTGYQYDATQRQLSFLPGSVISNINLDSRVITYDSQYLYASDYGVLGYADTPDDNGNREQAIAVRSALGYGQTFSIKEQDSNADIVILPSTLKSYIGHYREKLLGLRKSKGPEYDALHRLEENSAGRFKFEYFFFPFESTVRSITQTYSPTNITVTLGRRNRTLLVPQLPKPASIGYRDYHAQSTPNNISYSLYGQGGQYMIAMNQGATIYLDTSIATETTPPSRWILDSRTLASDDITFLDNKIIIDGVTIIIQSKQIDKVSLLKRDGELCDIDFANQRLTVSSEDASQWQASHQQTLEAHLQDLKKLHQLSGQYTAIDHYKHNQINVGRAYYDSKNDRIFFSQTLPVDATTLDQLIETIKTIQSEPIFSAINEIYAYEIFNPRPKQNNYQRSTFKKSISLNKPEQWKKLISILQANEHVVSPEFKALIIELKKLAAADGMVLQESLLYPQEQQRKLRRKSHTTEKVTVSDETIQRKAGLTGTLATLTNQINAWLTQLDNLRQLNTVSSQAELIGVIGNHAYFYHAEKKILWRTNCTTNIVEAQFLNPLSNPGRRRFWQENDAIYMACMIKLDATDQGELIYRIDAKTMTLLAINLADAQKDGSGLIDFLGKSISCGMGMGARAFIQPVFMQTAVFPEQVSAIKVSYVPFVTIAGKDSQGIMQHYWLESNGRILKPNLPLSDSTASTSTQQADPITVASPFPSDLVLAAKIPRPKSQNKIRDVFYFYSHAQQALYRQEGYGVTEAGASWPYDTVSRATRLITPQLIDILRVGENLFVLTADGLVQQVDQTGSLTLTAVNKTWLTQQGSHWEKALKTLANKGPTLAVIGMTGADKKTALRAWYHTNQLVVSTLQNTALEFLNIDPLGQYAHLFDPLQKKLYRQTLLNEAQLATAFTDDFSLTDPSSISVATDLFPAYHFQSATVVAGALRLVTSDGVILSIDYSGNTNLVGIDQAWQTAHAGTAFAPDVEKLVATETWKHRETLVLQGCATPTWYHIETKKMIQAADLTADDKPIFIGIDPHYAEAYIAYIYSATKGLYQYYLASEGAAIKPTLLNKNHIERTANTLLIRGTDDNDILQPLAIQHVDTLVMSGGEDQDIYQIDVEDRERYKIIAINNFDKNEAQDTLQLNVTDIEKVLMTRKDNDVLFIDSSGTVLIKEVFGSEHAYFSHLNIILSDTKQNRHEQSLSDLLGSMHDNTAHLIQSMTVFDKQPASSAPITSSTYETPYSNLLQIGPSVVSS